MIYYENVYKTLGGMKKVVERKKRIGSHIFVVTEKYFLGLKYREKSVMRMPSIFENIVNSIVYGVSHDDEVYAEVDRIE